MLPQPTAARKLARSVTIFRIVFGLIWAIDATMKWLPGFRSSFMMMLMDTESGQPGWLHWWFSFWMKPMMNHVTFFAYLTAVCETLIALAVIFGIARKPAYILGAVFAFLIWGIGEGFGGPYVSGSTDIGAACMYVVIFAGLFLLERAVPDSWSADQLIAKKLAWWPKISKP